MRILLLVLLLTALGQPSRAQADANEPPVAGRPEDFSELVGLYQISSTAVPTEVAVEDPVVVTVRISGTGARAYQPQRQKLRLFGPELTRDFYVEPAPEEDRRLEKENAWLFVYRLRPKRRDVKEVPALRLIYYSPVRKRFQTTYSEAIPLQVKPRPVAEPPAGAAKNTRPPPSFFELATGTAVLRPENGAGMSYGLFFVLALLPMGLCGGWYVYWRRLHPDRARRARTRRSRAAQLALRALAHEDQAAAERVFAIVIEYLQSRMDISIAEPTAEEVGRRLLRTSVTRGTRQQVLKFISACDAARFAPAASENSGKLKEDAVKLIKAMETDGVRQNRPAAKRSVAASISAAIAITLLLLGRLSAQQELKSTTPFPQELLGKAEQAFVEGKNAGDSQAKAQPAFARAAGLYDELRRQGIHNADLYRNIGNAQFLSGRLAHAVAAYRAGLRLSPNDRILQENLDYARSRVQYPPDCPPQEVGWRMPVPSIVGLQVITLVLFALASFLWTRRLITAKHTWPAVLISAGTVLAGAGLIWAEWQHLQEERYPSVVIAADGTALYRGNGESYPRHPTLPALAEGMEARRLVERGNWMQIELAGGQVGWIAKSAAVGSFSRNSTLRARGPAG